MLSSGYSNRSCCIMRFYPILVRDIGVRRKIKKYILLISIYYINWDCQGILDDGCRVWTSRNTIYKPENYNQIAKGD